MAELLGVETETADEYMRRGRMGGQALGKRGWVTSGQAILNFLAGGGPPAQEGHPQIPNPDVRAVEAEVELESSLRR